MTDERRGAAFHEAGHAVVAWSLGLQVDGVAIGLGGDDTKGRMDLASDPSRLPVLDQVALCLAGLVAEEFFDAPLHQDAGVSDHAKARGIIEDDTPDEDVCEEEIQRHLQAGYALAREKIAENEIQCRRLATRLQKHGRVSADEFMRLIAT